MPRIRNKNTRELLLEQGVVLLREKGYHGVGLKEILSSVNVPKGSFYHYFASKEDYVTQVLEHYGSDLKQQLNEYLEQPQVKTLSALEQLKAAYFFALDAYEQEGCVNGCLIGDLAAEVAATSEMLREHMLMAFGKWQDMILTLIEQGQRQQDIRSDIPASELSHMLWSTFEGGLLHMKIAKNADATRQSMQLLFDNLFAPQ